MYYYLSVNYLPTQISMKAGSKATFATFPKLLKISFSVQAHIPIIRMPSPTS